MTAAINYYYDDTNPLKPFTHEAMANPGSLPPKNAIRTAPAFAEGKWPVFENGGWTLIDDRRGQEGYLNGQPYKIEKLGPVPDGWTDTPPPPTAEEIKARKTADIQAKLNTYDFKTTRPLRTLNSLWRRYDIVNTEVEKEEIMSIIADEEVYLQALEDKAAAARQELSEL
jgi:hypothetical protein